MSDSPQLSTAEIPFSRRVLGLLIKMVACALGYVVFAGIIYLFESLGPRVGVPKLGILGLAINIVILGGLTFLAGDRFGGAFRAMGPVLALLIVILLFASIEVYYKGENASFWSVGNLRTQAMQASSIAVAALGMTLIIIAGGIDLSAGTAVALCATVMAWCFKQDSPLLGIALPAAVIGIIKPFENELRAGVAVTASTLAGCLAGAVNGTLVSLLRVVPFIVTLGSMTIFLGLGKLLSGNTPIRPSSERVATWIPTLVAQFPETKWISWPLLPNFANGVWLAVILAVLTSVVLHLTVFGRRVFAVGSNESTARLCGINVPLTKIIVYSLAGMFVGIAGMYQFARLSSGNPSSGIGLELKIIAAVVIGGGSLNGGQGSVVGTLTGAAIMFAIASGCTSLGMQNDMQDIIIGGIIVAAVAVDQWRQRRMVS